MVDAEASGLKLAKAGTDNTIRIYDGDSQAYTLDVITHSELFFPFLASAYKFGRGIVSAAQDRMHMMDHKNPNSLDFSFLDATLTDKRFFTSGVRDRSASTVPRPSNLEPGSTTPQRDSDLSLSSIKRNSAGFDGSSPTRIHFLNNRRTSASTMKSMSFDHDEDDFTVPQVADLLRLSQKLQRPANMIVSAREGEGDKALYMIMKGFCRVEKPPVELSLDENKIQPAEGPQGTILEPGDCFGLLTVNENRGNPLVRKTVIRTVTEVELIEIDLNSLWYMLNVYPALDRRLSRLHELRALEAWRTMDLNSCLRRLAAFQRTQLNAILELKEFKAGEELWPKRAGPRNAYLIAEGYLMFSEMSEESDEPFGAGAFLCDFHSMIMNRRASSSSTISSNAQSSSLPAGPSLLPASSVFPDLNTVEYPSQNTTANSSDTDISQHLFNVTLVAKTDCRLYQINWREAFQFLESNPGVLVQIYHSYVVE